MPYLDYSATTLEDLKDRHFGLAPEAAAILELDTRTVIEAIKRGEIPATKVGRQYRIPTAWLRAAVSGMAVTP
jgi:excisionase family DNA binding protein